jgi:hypothetical protein
MAGFRLKAPEQEYILRGDAMDLAIIAAGNMQRVLRWSHRRDVTAIAFNANQMMRALFGICLPLGWRLSEAIDDKMTINRQRKWRRDDTGHGYHIRQEKLESPSPQRGEGRGEGAYQSATSEASA